ncbi:hypothetical protein GBF38_012333 [Nibea albiflora]|uniref:Uncharacterized protein n=1 Tax=Nibea albiflora TaxID=240163 RepID=A0ACB7EII6_NIBAL|nr:hypothetical protein GBF38_012333 [Nibea albiflora]
MAAESTRRFTKNLLKPGSAAEIRQTACNAVRHSAVTSRRPEYATAITVRPLCPAALALLYHAYTDAHTHTLRGRYT